jgi:2-methylcitrate dehydratase
MDPALARIADYAHALRFEDLPNAVVHDAKRRLIDTLGCGVAAFDAEPARIARALAVRARVTAGTTDVTATGGASVLGSVDRSLPELAAFANGVMSRYLEGNDVFPGAGHPSDCIAAVLAAGEAAGAGGRILLTSVVLAYEVYHHLFRALRLRDKGLDYVLYTAGASAVGAAKAMGLPRERIGHALAIAVTANLGLAATRRGHLSMWKGTAGPDAARNGVFAALLAARGMSGPGGAIEGGHGLKEIAGRFEASPLGGEGGKSAPEFAILQADHKSLLTEYHSQAPITAALRLHAKVPAEQIAAVVIHSYRFTVNEIGSDPEKWHPTTRESADHSLPFIIAAVLIDGAFSDAIFSEERLRDPRIHALADKIAVREEAEFTRVFPQQIPCRIEITTRSGERHSASVDYPRGHHRDPMSDAELTAKFRALAGRTLPEAQLERALDLLWHFERADSVRPVFEALRRDAAKP